jgi:hypothetical protein
LALRPCGCGLQLGVTGIKTLQQFPSNTIGFILHDLIDLGEGREGRREGWGGVGDTQINGTGPKYEGFEIFY